MRGNWKLIVGLLLAAAALVMAAPWQSNDRNLPARGDFAVERLEAVDGVTFIERCTATGFSAMLDPTETADQRMRLTVRFTNDAGELLQTTHLPLVVARPDRAVPVDAPFDPTRVDTNATIDSLWCEPKFTPLSN